MKITLSFVLGGILLVGTSISVFFTDKSGQAQEIEANISKRLDELVQKVDQAQKKRKQYFYCAQTTFVGDFNRVMSGIFIVGDINEDPFQTFKKVEEYCKKGFGKDRVIVTVFNRID